MFETSEWKQYNDEFNKIAGGYRYRWGDCEVISMYCYMYFNNGFYNLKLKEKDLYHDQLPGTKMIFK